MPAPACQPSALPGYRSGDLGAVAGSAMTAERVRVLLDQLPGGVRPGRGGACGGDGRGRPGRRPGPRRSPGAASTRRRVRRRAPSGPAGGSPRRSRRVAPWRRSGWPAPTSRATQALLLERFDDVVANAWSARPARPSTPPTAPGSGNHPSSPRRGPPVTEASPVPFLACAPRAPCPIP